MKIKIIYSNRKSLAIQVKDGEVFARAPKNYPEDLIQIFVDSKKSWIEKHLDRYEAPGYQDGKPMRIFGTLTQVRVIEKNRVSIDYDGVYLTISRPVGCEISRIEKAIDTYMVRVLGEILKEDVEYYAGLLGIAVPPFKIRKYKRLHGRCTRGGELAFNTYLYHESADFIEYVVLHECAHLLEFNHGPQFYEIIEKYMPDYKERLRRQKDKLSY